MTLEERKNISRNLRLQGYNCAQSVLLAFEDKTGMDAATAAKISSGLGSGFGTGEICGVISGMALAQGMTQDADPKSKMKSAKTAASLAREFANLNQGRMRCCELKGKEGIRPCNELVEQGVEILHNYFESLEK